MGISLINPYRYSGGAGPSFDPSTLTGYEFDLYATSLGDLYSDGDTLDFTTGVPDETTNYNYNAVSNTPKYESNEVNGESIIQFISTDSDRLRDLTNDFPATNKFTQVWVMKTPSTATQVFLHKSETGSSYFLKRTDNDLNFYASNGVVNFGIGDFAPTPAAGNWWIIIWTVDFTAGSSYVYINDVTAQGSSIPGSADSTNIAAQYWHIPTDSVFSSIDLARIILYSGYILTSSEISDMFTYLGNLYNISVTT